MPHLTVHALEHQLAGREDKLIAALTDAVVEVYASGPARSPSSSSSASPTADGRSVAPPRPRSHPPSGSGSGPAR
ncbi:hypothetical protein ACFSVJ_27505 [Prauserella oleivorans]